MTAALSAFRIGYSRVRRLSDGQFILILVVEGPPGTFALSVEIRHPDGGEVIYSGPLAISEFGLAFVEVPLHEPPRGEDEILYTIDGEHHGRLHVELA